MENTEKKLFFGSGFSAGPGLIAAENIEEAEKKMEDAEWFWTCNNGNYPDHFVREATEEDLKGYENAPKL